MFLALMAAAWAAKPVPLAFAWPHDDHAILTQTIVQEVPLWGRVHRDVSQQVHEAHVTREGSGWRLALTHRSSALVEVAEGERGWSEAQLSVAAGDFAYELGPEGQLVSLEGWGEASRRGLAAYDTLVAGLPPDRRTAMTEVLQAALSVEALEHDAHAGWWAPALVGRRFRPGRPVVTTTQTDGSSTVSSVTTTTLRAEVPCAADGAARCVELTITEVPDAAATSAAHREIAPSVSSYRVPSTTRLLVEPDTLPPCASSPCGRRRRPS